MVKDNNTLTSKNNDMPNKSSKNKDNSDISTNDNLNNLSQDEIDSLIKSSSLNSNDILKPEIKDDNEDSDSLELISQDDINRLIQDTEFLEKDTVAAAQKTDIPTDFNELIVDSSNKKNQTKNVKIESKSKENIDENSETSVSNLTSDDIDGFIDDLDKISLYDIKNNFEKDKTIIENSDTSTLQKIRDKQNQPSENNNFKKKLSYMLIGLVLLILLSGGYFSFFYKLNNKTQSPKLQINDEQNIQTNFTNKGGFSKTGTNLKTSVIKELGEIKFKKFLILTSDKKNDIIYITADILIEYTDKQAYDKMMKHTAFYRNIIYDAMKKSIEIENKDKIEKYFSATIKNALNTAMKAQYIDKVTFISFETG